MKKIIFVFTLALCLLSKTPAVRALGTLSETQKQAVKIAEAYVRAHPEKHNVSSSADKLIVERVDAYTLQKRLNAVVIFAPLGVRIKAEEAAKRVIGREFAYFTPKGGGKAIILESDVNPEQNQLVIISAGAPSRIIIKN